MVVGVARGCGGGLVIPSGIVSRLKRSERSLQAVEPRPLPYDRGELRELAETLKALADETRLSILTMLLAGEMCVCEIMDALPLSQPAISHHLRVLRQAGLVTDRREGRWIYYDLNPAGVKAVQAGLQERLIRPLGRRRSAGPGHAHPRCGTRQ